MTAPRGFPMVFASTLADINAVRAEYGLPALTAEQMLRLQAPARRAFEEAVQAVKESTAALGLSHDVPGGIRNDNTARIQVISHKMIQAMLAELRGGE